MHTLSRRNLLKGSLAAGVAASAIRCSKPVQTATVQPPFTVNLICGGMLAFCCEKGSTQLTILIPTPKDDQGKLCHDVRFGGIGGSPLGPGDYDLKLPGVDADPNRRVFSPVDNLTTDQHFVFNNSVKPIQSYAKIFVSLPAPDQVKWARIVRKTDSERQKGLPFFSGDAVSLKVDPVSFPGVYILTYPNVTGTVGLYPRDGNRAAPVEFGGPATLSLNIHLYCERPYGAPDEDHIPLFNQMFTLNGKPLHFTHDCSNAQGIVPCLGQDTLANDISPSDVATLNELKVPPDGSVGTAHDHPQCPPEGTCPLPDGKPLSEKEKTILFVDPASCINGWVYSGT